MELLDKIDLMIGEKLTKKQKKKDYEHKMIGVKKGGKRSQSQKSYVGSGSIKDLTKENLDEGSKTRLGKVARGKVKILSNDDLFDAATQLDNTIWQKAAKSDVLKWTKEVEKEMKNRDFHANWKIKPTFG